MYLRLQSVGKDKLDTRWEDGVFAGVREESGELYVMREEGVIKVRSFQRKPEEERWNQAEFLSAKGLPCQPIPGGKDAEVKSHFQYKEVEEEILPMPGTRESILRRIYIRREDVADDRYGLTPGCRGCEAANRGGTGIHNEGCRLRIEKAISIKEPDRFNKVLIKYGLKTGEILCTSFDRKENGELTGTGYIKFRNSIVARLAIYEMGETDDPRNSGWAMNCGNSQCRVYMQPSNREMVLPLYPWCSLDASPDLRNIRFPGAQWLPVGPRGIDHPRMYSELNGLVICDEFSDELIDDHGTGTQDSWLTVAGIDHHIENRTICHNCGAEGHIVSHCHLEANQLAREQALAERRRQSSEAHTRDS